MKIERFSDETGAVLYFANGIEIDEYELEILAPNNKKQWREDTTWLDELYEGTYDEE